MKKLDEVFATPALAGNPLKWQHSIQKVHFNQYWTCVKQV